MAYDSRVYRILIASPSDVLEEREAAVRVMQDWNDLQSYSRRVVILPLTEVLQSLSHIRRRADCLSTAKIIKSLIFQSLCHRRATGVSPSKWL
jgi:hypothetical protein